MCATDYFKDVGRVWKSVLKVGPYLRAREQFVRAWVYDTLQMCGIIDITKR